MTIFDYNCYKMPPTIFKECSATTDFINKKKIKDVIPPAVYKMPPKIFTFIFYYNLYKMPFCKLFTFLLKETQLTFLFHKMLLVFIKCGPFS